MTPVVLVMGHVSHHNRWIHEDCMYQVDPSNVDANICKVFPYIIDMVCMHACNRSTYAKHYFVDFNKIDLIVFKNCA